jgi:hypothetical protein
VNYYIQWDDSWLLSVLRREYLRIKEGREKSGKDRSVSEVRLEELLSNAKFYYSLFKRGDTFREVDSAFVKALPKSFPWGVLTKTNPDRPSSGEKLEKRFSAAVAAISKRSVSNSSESLQTSGFFLASLIRVLSTGGKGVGRAMAFLDDAANALNEKAGLSDVLLIRKGIKPGVSNDKRLVSRSGEVIRLGQISRVADELEQAAYLCPPFFVFLYREGGLENENLSALRQQFGELLADQFVRRTKNMVQSR